MPLYFIALLPPDRLLEEITQLKLELKERFGLKHALKLPPHITLQIPFSMTENLEPILEESLLNFARNEEKFRLKLKGFGGFKTRVLYIHIEQPEPVIELHERLQEMLINTVGLEEKERVARLHPHITLATRDVKKEIFKQLWQEYKERDFEADFLVEQLFVFKHNGRTWDEWRRFELG